MTADATQTILMYFVIPIWVLAGIADWACHRATGIAHTTGAKESIIHLLMLAEIGIPVLAGLFLEINALVIAIGIIAFLVHEATAMWDVSYAVKYREVTPFEQHVHSFLEMVPLMALIGIVALHWDQFLALFGLGTEPARWNIAWKRNPLPAWYLAATLGALLLLEALPYAEELWRTLRANQGALVPPKARTTRDLTRSSPRTARDSRPDPAR